MAQGSVSYSISLDNSRFLAGTRAAQKAVGNMASSIATSMAGIAKIATATAAVGGLTAGFMGLKKAITAAADMETLVVQFKTLTGSAEEAQATMAALANFANSTPFELPEVAPAAAKLLNANVPAAKLMTTLKALGNVAAASTAPLGTVATIYGQVAAKQKLMAEEILQFGENGVGALKLLSQSLGVSQSKVLELASAGKLGFGDLEKAILDVGTGTGAWANAMSEQAGTVNGLLSSLSDAWRALFVIIGQPINDFLKPILESSITRLSVLGSGLKAFIGLMNSARQDGQLGDFLGTSMVLGAKQAINVFSSGIRGAVAYLGAALPAVFAAAQDSLLGQRFMIAVESIFRAGGDIFNAAIKEGIAALMEATGQRGDAAAWREAAGADQDRAGLRMQTAYGAIAGINGADIAEAAAKILGAHQAGAAAFEAASKEKIFDTKADFKKLKTTAIRLDPAAWKTFEDSLKGKLPEAVKGAADKIKGPAEAAGRALQTLAAATKTGNPAAASKALPAAPEEVRRGLKSKEQSELDRANRRSAYDVAKNPFNLRGLNRFKEDSAALFPVAGLKVPRDAAAGQQDRATRREREAAAAMNKSEQLLASIDRRLSALGLAS
jgi:tape measure domain-containing protein